MQVDGGIERTSHISDIVKQSLNAWTSGAGGKNTMNRFSQMKCLQEHLQYLQYLQLKKEYDEKKVGVEKTLKKKKHDYVQQELHKFDKHVKAIKKRAKWGWSPLYQLLFLLQVGP
jgi:hypothetical protein